MTEKNDFVDMVDRLEYDEMEYRAIQAEVSVWCVYSQTAWITHSETQVVCSFLQALGYIWLN